MKISICKTNGINMEKMIFMFVLLEEIKDETLLNKKEKEWIDFLIQRIGKRVTI